MMHTDTAFSTPPVPFNKPFFSAKAQTYIAQALAGGSVSGDGAFTKKCHAFFESRYGFPKVLLTTSCTDALELAALLIGLQAGDEVIMPSYTFVSTANAFLLRGAKIVFADSEPERPHLDASKLEPLITPQTKAIVPVHYGGTACEMETILALAKRYDLFVIEDAAQSIDSFYNAPLHKSVPQGSLGHLSTFSFHESKNITSGEGGMLVINDDRFQKRAEIIREKGTNRSAFFRGEIDKYGWMDIGSSFLLSDILAACLYSQLEILDDIQQRRRAVWQTYFEALLPLEQAGRVRLPVVPTYTAQNGHLFYLLCHSLAERTALIEHLKRRGINAVFHYQALHVSPYFRAKHDGRPLPHAERYTDCLVRLPLYAELSLGDASRIAEAVCAFFSR